MLYYPTLAAERLNNTNSTLYFLVENNKIYICIFNDLTTIVVFSLNMFTESIKSFDLIDYIR